MRDRLQCGVNFLRNYLLHLLAVLLVPIPASFLRLVDAYQHVLQRLLLALVTDLPGQLLAVLSVAVLLGLLRASLQLMRSRVLSS